MTFFRLDKAAQTVILFAALVTACSHGENATHEEKSPEPKPRIGYGLVNAWHLQEPAPLAQALDDAGLGLTAIEWAPAWGVPRNPHCNDGSSAETYPMLAGIFVDAMRAHGIETNIIIVNMNGCAQRAETDSYVTEAVTQIREGIGIDKVLLTVVSEPWASSSKAEHWTRLGWVSWTGMLVLPDAGQNHRTGRPYYPSIPFELLDVHYCNDNELVRDLADPHSNILHNTDCTPITNPGPERAARFAGLAAASGSPLLVYDFKGLSPDYATIAAMGDAVRPRLTMRHR